MTSRTIITSSGDKYTGCSKLMIASMIHFSHICNTKGVITDFKTSDLTLVLRCNLKSAYNVLKALEDRELIHISDKDSFTGTRTITLIGNDFSNIRNKESHGSLRYLNTNYPFFNYRQNTGYDKFLDLSLFSMRLLILLLFHYNKQNGYRVSYDTLCQQLNIKKRSYIHKYINELYSFLPSDIICEKSNQAKRIKYGSISIHSFNTSMMPEYAFTKSQDTYYTRFWIIKMKKAGFSSMNETGSLHYISNRICSIINTFLKKGRLSLSFIENSIDNLLSDHKILDEKTFTDIYQYLLAAS